MQKQAILGKAGKLLAASALLLGGSLLVNTLRLPALPASDGKAAAAPADLSDAVARLAAAIRLPTVSHGPEATATPNPFPAFHQLLATSFPLTHARLQREVISEGSLLYTWQGSDASLPPLLLTAHMDTVPVEPGTEGKWQHAPFSGDIADGYVWGRGTMDMKHGVMATLEGVEHLLAQGYVPRRTILIAFGHDEEIGGTQGAARITALLEQRHIRPWFSLDEGLVIINGFIAGAQRPIAQIGLAEKGMLSLALTAKAEGGHSSMPPALTAVGRVSRAVARLEEQPLPATLTGPGGAGIRAMAPALPLASRVVIANSWLLEPLLLRQLEGAPATNALIRTTTAPTMISGGVKENVLPAEARAIVNFRLAPGDTPDSVLAHVRKVIDDPAIEIASYDSAGVAASAVADQTSPGFRLIADAARKVEPAALVTPGLVVGATDSRYYGRISGAAFRFLPVHFTPQDVPRVHGTDERISIADYGGMINFYIELIRSSTGAP